MSEQDKTISAEAISAIQPNVKPSTNSTASANKAASSKKKIPWAAIVGGVWVLFSLGYMGVDQWDKAVQKAVNARMQEAVNYGRRNAVESIMQLGNACKPVELSMDKNKMSLVNIACYNKQGEPQSTPQSAENAMQVPPAPTVPASAGPSVPSPAGTAQAQR